MLNWLHLHNMEVKKHYEIAFWVTLSLAILLIVVGFSLPPRGQVDPTVLTSIGELFLWPALAFGAKALEEGHKATIRKGDTSITIGNTDDKEMPAPPVETIITEEYAED